MQRLIDNFKIVFQPKRKPKLIFRIISSYIRNITNVSVKKKPLRNIDIAINYNCNLTCEHCSCENMKKDTSMIDENVFKRIAKEGLELGAIYFSFTGGEPLINDDLEDIVRLFSPESCLIGLQTNALLLTEKRIESLYEAGVDALQISLDSFKQEEHDSFRNMKGAYRETIKNMEMAIKKGFKIIICTTITNENIRSDGLLKLLEYTHEKNLPIVVSIPCPVGRWSGNFSVLLNDEDREYLRLLKKKFPHLRRDFDSNYTKMGCSAGTEKLYITPYGDVIPCPFIHISFGNVRSEPLSVIRERMLRVSRFTTYNQICLAGEDKNFINKYIVPTYNVNTLPQMWDNHPVLSNECRGGEENDK